MYVSLTFAYWNHLVSVITLSGSQSDHIKRLLLYLISPTIFFNVFHKTTYPISAASASQEYILESYIMEFNKNPIIVQATIRQFPSKGKNTLGFNISI